MHIPDGILPPYVIAGGYALTGAITFFVIKRIKKTYSNPSEIIPTASLLTAVFFVAGLIHIPVPPASVHLLLSGLMGIVLGWFAFLAILIGLFFQAVMFQHGGLTTLGVNACLIGIPALVSFGIFRLRNTFGAGRQLASSILAFVSGFSAVAIGALAASTLLILTIPAGIDASVERAAIMSLLAAHMPLGLIEGVFTSLVASFLLQVKPELLEASA